jgi:hypothetical protein
MPKNEEKLKKKTQSDLSWYDKPKKKKIKKRIKK